VKLAQLKCVSDKPMQSTVEASSMSVFMRGGFSFCHGQEVIVAKDTEGRFYQIPQNYLKTSYKQEFPISNAKNL
jgi:hypothetical protein